MWPTPWELGLKLSRQFAKLFGCFSLVVSHMYITEQKANMMIHIYVHNCYHCPENEHDCFTYMYVHSCPEKRALWFIIVCHHEDWGPKNKRMFRIPTYGLFLTCTENFFILRTHIKINRVRICYLLKENILLGKEVNCPCACCISLTPRTHFPPTEHLFLHKDDINRPNSSAGHNNVYLQRYTYCYSAIWLSRKVSMMIHISPHIDSFIPQRHQLEF